jgi:hypothetical protein
MTPDEIKIFLTDFQSGTSVKAPLTTTLGPDTEPIFNTLTRVSEKAFSLTTTFREFWAGNGWSGEQTETEAMSLEKLEGLLKYYDLKDFSK